MTTGEGSAPSLSVAAIALMKGVVYRDTHERAWQHILRLRPQLTDHMAVIGLDVHVDEAEGWAYLRARPDDPDQPLPRLIPRHKLPLLHSLLLALLRKALLEVERCSAAIQSARRAMESGVRTGRTNLGEALKLARGAVKCEWPGARVAVNVDDDAVIDLSAETAVYLLSAEITQSIATLRTTEVQTLRVRAKRDGDGFTVRMTCGVRRASGGTP